MDLLNHIASGLPSGTTKQKAACVQEIEAVARSLIERGASLEVAAAALAAVSLKILEDDAQERGYGLGAA